ncbi:MAG: hypothetical protein M3N17_02665 [Actinomycetota bacterium]|nr:hypothetical protein [Actinomycetota bacterium]
MTDRAPDWREDLRRVERRMRAELRAEAEEYERLAALDLLRGRTLADVARELVGRGDIVAVTAGGRTFVGPVVHAAGDLACVRAAGEDVDVNLPATAAVRVVERRRSGGSPGAGPDSFKARLFEHERAGVPAEVGWAGERLLGVVRAVAVDHVVMDDDDGQRWHLAIARIAYVASPRA